MADNTLTLRVAVEGGEASAVQIERVGTATEQVEKKSKEASKGLSMFGRGLSGLRTAFGYALGVGGFAGLAFGLGDAVKNAQAFQVATAGMSNAIKAAGLNVRPATKAMQDYADSLAIKGGFTPTETITGLTTLVRVTRSVSGAEKDMTLATNIARGAHVSLSQATRAVMMAEAGRLTGLTRLGIILPKNVSTTRAMSILMQRYAGATQAYSNTSAGAMGNLSHVLDILGEKVGMMITPLIIDAAHAMTGFIDGWEKMSGVGGRAHAIFSQLVGVLGNVWGWISKNRSMVMELGAVVLGTMAAWKAYEGVMLLVNLVQKAWAGAQVLRTVISLIPEVSSLRDAWLLLNMTMDANPIGLIIGLVAALAAGFVLAYNKVGWFRTAVQDVWGWIKKNWPLLLEIFLGPVGGIVLAITHFGQLKSAASSAFNSIKSAITGSFDSAVNAVISGINWMIRALDKLHIHIPSILGMGGANIGFNIPTIGLLGAGSGAGNGPSSGVGHRAQGGFIYGQHHKDTVPFLGKPGEYVATDDMVSDVGRAAMDSWRNGGPPPGDSSDLVAALQAALQGMAVVMDGQQVGFVMARQGVNAKALR